MRTNCLQPTAVVVGDYGVAVLWNDSGAYEVLRPGGQVHEQFTTPGGDPAWPVEECEGCAEYEEHECETECDGECAEEIKDAVSKAYWTLNARFRTKADMQRAITQVLELLEPVRV